MSDIINLLPDSVANQIAAGEVIQRPASVVKELLENALDAGATNIILAIKDAGNSLVQVIDNGKGMSVSDARISFERHATSKIKGAEDLFTINTMGFRGEALASIAAVAQVELKTRREEDELGSMIEIAGSRVFAQNAVQTEKGTNIAVKNLFFNVPARRRFLKSHSTERMHIRNEFYRVVLVHPEIQFTFFDDDKEILRLEETTLKGRIEHVFSVFSNKKLDQQLLPIEVNSQIVNIKGFVGRPEFTQKSAYQFFFVNNRYMKHPYFHKAVMIAYDKLIRYGEQPNYFIYFDIAPQTIDINIHPAKTEIKFENEKAIWSMILSAVKESLGKFQVAPSLDFDVEDMIDIPVYNPQRVVNPPVKSFNPNYNPFEQSKHSGGNKGWEKMFEQPEFEQNNGNNLNLNIDSSDSFVSNIALDKSNKDSELFVIADIKNEFLQYKNSFIITNVKSGLLLINQHRAHYRVVFDRLMSLTKENKSYSQQLLFPEILELDGNDTEVLDSMIKELNLSGFMIEKTLKNSLESSNRPTSIYEIRGVPSELGGLTAIPLLQDLIYKISKEQEDIDSVIREKINREIAAKVSIRSGQYLSQEEMSKLIESLFLCENHSYSPDGKSIISLIEDGDISSRFND